MTDPAAYLRGEAALPEAAGATAAPPVPDKARAFLEGRLEALGRFQESAPGDSAAEGAAVAGVARNIREMEALRKEGVDITGGGANFGQRMEMAFTPEARVGEFLKNNFEDYRKTPAGLVVSVKGEDGQVREVLLDEAGFSLSDIADASPELLKAGGALAGSIAAAPLLLGSTAGGAVSVVALAGVASLSEMLVGTTGETVAALRNGGLDLDKPEDLELLANIFKENGKEAGENFLLDVALAGGGRLLRGAGRFLDSPLGKSMSGSPQDEIRAAADELGVELSAGTRTQSPTIIRAEAIAEQVPGSAGPIKKARELEDETLRAATDGAIEGRQTAGEFGESVSATLTRQRDEAADEVERMRMGAEARANDRVEELRAEMATRPLSTNEAGELSRRAIQREQSKFRGRQEVLAQRTKALIAQLAPQQRAFASTKGLKQVAKDLQDEFPRGTVVETVDDTPVVRQEVIPELFPREARRILDGFAKLDDAVSVDELRRVRGVVSQMITDKDGFPGVGVGMLKKLEAELTVAIREAADNAPNAEIRAALLDELNHFREGVQRFRTKPVVKATRGEDAMGFVEGEDVLPNLFFRGRFEDAGRILNVIGENSIAAKAARRSVFEKILTNATDSTLGSGVVDAKIVLKELDKMGEKGRDMLFRGRGDEVLEVFRVLGARQGSVDVSVLRSSPGTEDMVELLRDAAQKELDTRRVFERQVFRRILSDELDVTQMKPDQFVRFTLRDATPAEIDELFKRLPEDQAQEFRVQTIAHILEKSRGSSDTVIQALRRADGGVEAGDALSGVLTSFAEDGKGSLEKLTAVLGEDGMKLLRSAAIVQAARAERASAASAAGGLIGGTIISNLSNLKLGTVTQIAKYRILAGLLNFGPTRSWLTRANRIPDPSRVERIGVSVLPQFYRAVSEVYGEQSEEAALARDLEENLPELMGQK